MVRLTDKIEVYNMDCMEYMKDLPDNHFELSIVDPPYGIEASHKKSRNGTSSSNLYNKEWDSNPIDEEYFIQLFRVSKNQIIWGGNYFRLPPTRGFIIWDKCTGKNSYADCELAWTSFDRVAKIFKKAWLPGCFVGIDERIHPTQKPVKLYEWILKNYANEGDKILDTHLGSGSSAIACHNYVYEFVGLELDEDYFNDMVKRFKQVTAQTDIFR